MIHKSKFYDKIPSPFALAIFLTFFTFLLALFITPTNGNYLNKSLDIIGYFGQGFWDLLKFSMQMVMILILGSMIARTPVFTNLMKLLSKPVKTTAGAAAMVALATILAAYLNWGLGLIFGALLAKHMSEFLQSQGLKTNAALLGAAGYSGLMIWHGGLSGSAPLKIAENGHFLMEKIGVIGVGETIFSNMNIVAFVLVILIVPLYFFLMGRKHSFFEESVDIKLSVETETQDGKTNLSLLSLIFMVFLLVAISVLFFKSHQSLNLNMVNLILFVVAFLLYGNIQSFTKAATESVQSTTGILLQFPIYAGIMAVMSSSGLTNIMTDFFIEISNTQTFPIFTMISAGIVNIFVPSGGGQWAVQGPVIVDAAQQLGVPVSKAVMALAYGDQLTNMIQPFWALPLLSITGLKAGQILKYSFPLMLIGFVIFGLVLWGF